MLKFDAVQIEKDEQVVEKKKPARNHPFRRLVVGTKISKDFETVTKGSYSYSRLK